MSNELVINPETVLVSKNVLTDLGGLREEVLRQVYDASAPEGRKQAGSTCAKLRKLKAEFERKKKELTAEYKAVTKKIDTQGKQARDFIDELIDDFDAPRQRWIEKTQARIDSIKPVFNDNLGNAVNSDNLRQQLENAKDFEIDDSFQDYKKQAETAKAQSIEQLESALHAALALEEKARIEAELAEQQRIAAEKAKIEAAEKTASEKARLEAEAKARTEREALERKQRETEAAVQREKERAIKLEREKIAAEERAKIQAQQAKERAELEQKERERITAEEKARREADVQNRKRVNSQILADFVAAGLSQGDAVRALEALADGKISNVTINY